MKKHFVCGRTLVLFLTTVLCGNLIAQSDGAKDSKVAQSPTNTSGKSAMAGQAESSKSKSPATDAANRALPTPTTASQPARTPRIAFGAKMSLLGVGMEVATPLTRRSNLRAGFNVFNYNRSLNEDGINYDGHLNFRSMETHYDWFPFSGGFHLSPGLLVYNGMQVKANASVPGGQSFSLGDSSYVSDPTNPLKGTGKLEFNKVGPMFTAGWGNLLPRSGRRFSIPFEVGFAYMGSPRATLNLTGSACDAPGLNCRNAATDPTVQSNVQSEQSKLNDKISAFKIYPVISVGFSVNFGRQDRR